MFDLPFHPTIPGLQALGFTNRGRVIWPVMGGAEDADGDGDGGEGDGGDADNQAQQGGDQGNSDRGFPENTPIAEMTDSQRANYFKFHDRRKSDRLKAYGDITPEQALQWKQEADDARRNQLQPNERALEDARTEAAAQAAQGAAAEWVPLLAEEIVGHFITDEDQRQHVMSGIDPMKFLKDGKFDRDALVGHLTGLAAAFGGNGNGDHQPRQWGQSGDRPPATKASDLGLAEAKRRGFVK